jgi:hypothetical protein
VRLFCEAPRVASAPNCVPTTHKTSMGSPQARFCSVLRQLKMFLFGGKIKILVSEFLHRPIGSFFSYFLTIEFRKAVKNA